MVLIPSTLRLPPLPATDNRARSSPTEPPNRALATSRRSIPKILINWASPRCLAGEVEKAPQPESVTIEVTPVREFVSDSGRPTSDRLARHGFPGCNRLHP